jgi:hypothetical protein
MLNSGDSLSSLYASHSRVRIDFRAAADINGSHFSFTCVVGYPNISRFQNVSAFRSVAAVNGFQNSPFRICLQSNF